MAATSDAAVGSIVGATMRLTVLGDGTGGDVARVDLVVPVWAEVADVARAWLEATGAPEGAPLPVLRRTTGAVLDPEGALERSGLRHGAVLLAGDPGAEDPAGGPGDDDAADPRPGGVGVLGGRRAWTVVVAALAVVTGALAAGLGRDAGEGSGLVGTATTVCLAVATLLALLPVGGDHVRAARLHVAPFCLAGAALVGLSPSSTHPLLPVTVAALAALATAAAAWALGDDDAVTLVWLWSAGLLSAACVVLLLTGAGAAGLWALLLVGGVVAVRLLPSLVVDVPDETLLDLETLAVTAWSATTSRDRPADADRWSAGPRSGRWRDAAAPSCGPPRPVRWRCSWPVPCSSSRPPRTPRPGPGSAPRWPWAQPRPRWRSWPAATATGACRCCSAPPPASCSWPWQRRWCASEGPPVRWSSCSPRSSSASSSWASRWPSDTAGGRSGGPAWRMSSKVSDSL